MLIVEDERVTRRALQVLLTASGFRASACDSAEAALTALERGAAPAFVVVDVDLPGMNGLELADKVHDRFPATKIILATACDFWRVNGFLREHDCHYLRKPVDVARLLEVLSDPGKPN